ncbi:MAG: hypothetical protein ABIB41_01670 [Nitrospirota bacterium]
MHAGESLENAEREALRILDSELSRHGKLNMQAFNLVGITLCCLPEQNIQNIPLSQRIATSLLVHISNDLRTSSLLALGGYAVQAV